MFYILEACRLRERLLNREACYYPQCRPSHATVLVGLGGGGGGGGGRG